MLLQKSLIVRMLVAFSECSVAAAG